MLSLLEPLLTQQDGVRDLILITFDKYTIDGKTN